MTDHHHEHEIHDHGHHGRPAPGHAHHGPVAHVPSGDVDEAYAEAYAAAQPEAERTVVPVQLDSRETDWEFREGRPTRAWGFNGQVPGPTIEAHVGDVVEIRLT